MSVRKKILKILLSVWILNCQIIYLKVRFQTKPMKELYWSHYYLGLKDLMSKAKGNIEHGAFCIRPSFVLLYRPILFCPVCLNINLTNIYSGLVSPHYHYPRLGLIH